MSYLLSILVVFDVDIESLSSVISLFSFFFFFGSFFDIL